MSFLETSEHVVLRDVTRRFFEARSPESAVRHQMESVAGFDPKLWRDMAQQLGLQGTVIPERYGGAGLGYRELAIIMEEVGRSLVCAPFYSTVVLAAPALLESGDERTCAELLPAIAAGELTATLAVTERRAEWIAEDTTVTLRRKGDTFVLSGVKNYIPDGQTADVLLVVARGERGLSLCRVDSDASGVARTSLPTMDLTRRQARIEFSETPAQIIGHEGEAWPVVERVLHKAAIALGCEQLGGAQRCLEMAVDYAKMRVAFGRVIGSFQAIKHKCADMVVDIELARSAAIHACNCVDGVDPTVPLLASMLKAMCSEMFLKASMENIQIHGGIGYTWEHPAHLYLKRAKADYLQLGDPIHHRKLVACALGI
jgi:alkylation response protein AidB-like acyl-CoA dehydrogenase